MSRTLLLLAVLAASATPSLAQALANDAYQVNYYANAINSDQQIRIVNTGQIGSPIDPATRHGAVCADIYVFDARQEMIECCSCSITANGLLTLSLQNQLASNPLTGVLPDTGVVKIVSDTVSSSGSCDAQSISAPINASLRAFGSHAQGGPLTETLFSTAPLTSQEANFLSLACSFVNYLGSGKGICTCSTRP
jgi:hypothetical protein